jgi:hypothetical protein
MQRMGMKFEMSYMTNPNYECAHFAQSPNFANHYKYEWNDWRYIRVLIIQSKYTISAFSHPIFILSA